MAVPQNPFQRGGLERLHWHPQTFIQGAENRTHLGRQRYPRVSIYREDKDGAGINQHRCLLAGQADDVLLVALGDSHGAGRDDFITKLDT